VPKVKVMSPICFREQNTSFKTNCLWKAVIYNVFQSAAALLLTLIKY